MIKLKELLREEEKRESNKAYETFYNAYKDFANATMTLAKATTKITGNSVAEKIILKNYKKQVIPFIGLMQSWNKGQQKNPHLKEIIKESPDHDMFKALHYVNDDIFRIMNKYDGKANMDAVFRSWMLGLHSKLKKAGVKI